MPILAQVVPTAQACFMLGTWAICYIIATSLGHVPYWLPMISDCLVFSPEGPFARWGLVTAQNLLLLSVVLIFRYQRRCTAHLPPDAAPWPLAGCLMSDHADFAIGLLGTFCGLQPLIVNEMEEGMEWRTCDHQAPVGSPTGFDANGDCNISATCVPPAVSLESGEICLGKYHGSFHWHSDFAAAYIVLLMPLYVWRLTARALYLRQRGVPNAPSQRSVNAKLAISAVYLATLCFAATLSGPWKERKVWTAFSEWLAVLCITCFVLTTANDFGSHAYTLDELLTGSSPEGEGAEARAKHSRAPSSEFQVGGLHESLQHTSG
jgi:hypothetical protein